jgi:Fe(3+) dicitrate transport protein
MLILKKSDNFNSINKFSARLAALPLTLWLFLAPLQLAAQQEPSADPIYEEVLVTGGSANIRTLSGSASLLDESQILAFDSVDINNLLRQVPGVYLRVEDGYGLRPNIGLRGATSERSQKITLMEDGVLIAPAPYSAPAAYYMPNINRMSSIEVFKGPSSIKHGPHTVGGALNLVTPGIPEYAEGKVEAVTGTDNYQKYRLFYGETVGQWGYWIDGLRYSTGGFKELDTGGDTGFMRNDLNAKIQWRSENSAAIEQTLQLKLGYADEDSNETYLGLTDHDFADKSVRRYVASELDQFESKHYQLQLFHQAKLNEHWQVDTQAYHNKFSRNWFKFDGFISDSAAATAVVLANPDFYPRELALLRGEVNSNATERETLDVTDFIRDYGASGIGIKIKHQRNTGKLGHNFEGGLRYHHDYVERKQDQQGYLMQDASLVSDGVSRELTLSNKWQTDAVAAFITDSIDYGNWTFDLGVRYEYIDGKAKNRLTGVTTKNDQDIWLPGLGVFYQLTDKWGLLAGINKGFSPASPGASSGVSAEESVSYEYGIRYTDDNVSADVIGFFSDYENLLGRCRVSDLNCTAGEEFNGGDVEVAGWEVTTNYTHNLGNGLIMPLSLVYTYTETAFQSTFFSSFSQWNPGFFDGIALPVRQGDELPYTPDHQARFQAGLEGMKWSANLALRYVSEMREVPGSGNYENGKSTQAYTIMDLSASYDITDRLSFKFIAANLADEEVVVSRRPFGARPNLPRQFKLGVSYQL